MNHNLEVATDDFALYDVIINYGTLFQEEMGGFLCLCRHLQICSKDTVEKAVVT
jgi:hypothetical protein